MEKTQSGPPDFLRSAPHHVHQQLQDTAWYTLPDGTWLTVIDWSKVLRWCWCR